MAMVGGLDLHRQQITFDVVDVETRDVWRGRLWQPDRQRFRRWLREELTQRAGTGTVKLAVEGCTGWRYVVEEICAAGFDAYLAEPADTQAARGRKRHAKTDRSDARLLRELLAASELPESWIPPTPVLEWRERVRLYKSMVDQRTQWVQRIHAELYQHGVAVPEGAIRSDRTRELLAGDTVELSSAGRQRINVGYRMIEATDGETQPLKHELQRFGQRQPACRALIDAHYGIGGLIAVAVWSELGDCRRFSRSLQVVRHTGLDVTVDASDRRRARGFLSRQGPETLRWALYEAAKNASRERSPDHHYYATVKQRHDGKLARDLDGPQARSSLLSHPAQPRPRTRLRDALTIISCDGRHRPSRTSGSRGQLLPPACPPASVLDGLLTTTRSRSQPLGGHSIKIVVADDTDFVEHLGNAGRPQAVANRAKTRVITQDVTTPTIIVDAHPHTGNAGYETDVLSAAFCARHCATAYGRTADLARADGYSVTTVAGRAIR